MTDEAEMLSIFENVYGLREGVAVESAPGGKIKTWSP